MPLKILLRDYISCIKQSKKTCMSLLVNIFCYYEGPIASSSLYKENCTLNETASFLHMKESKPVFLSGEFP